MEGVKIVYPEAESVSKTRTLKQKVGLEASKNVYPQAKSASKTRTLKQKVMPTKGA